MKYDIDSLYSWRIKWKLFIDPSKCATMCLALSPKGPPSHSINDISVKNGEEYRDLGVIVSTNLSWTDHYKYMCSKACHSLNFIRRSISISSSIALKKSLLFL